MNQNSSGQFGSQEKPSDLEISLLDIFFFLKRSYVLILLTGILGVLVSFGYLLITPKQYQASAQIQMAQIGLIDNNMNYNNHLVSNIEEPALLIARLSFPTSYSAEVVEACGLKLAKDAQAILSKSVSLTIPRGVANTVDLKIIGASPEESINCAQTVFELIKTTQAKIILPYIEEAKAKLLENQERLSRAKDLVMKADKSGSAMDAAYLSTRDEIRFFLDQITKLNNVVTSNEKRATRLVAPIYARNDPVAPKKRNVLMAGLFGGILLGLLIAIGRQLISSFEALLERHSSDR